MRVHQQLREAGCSLAEGRKKLVAVVDAREALAVADRCRSSLVGVEETVKTVVADRMVVAEHSRTALVRGECDFEAAEDRMGSVEEACALAALEVVRSLPRVSGFGAWGVD